MADAAEQPAPMLLDCSRGEGVVTLTFSGGERLELAPEALPPDLPPVGAPVPAPLLALLRSAAERKAVARRIFSLLDQRLWTVARLREKLAADGFAAGSVAAVLERFAAEGLVSDRRYADAYCRDALARKPVGRLWLLSRLAAQGVPPAEAGAAVAAALPPERERELAEAAAARRWERAGADAAAGARVARFLVARGFPPALARRAAAQTAPRRGREEDG